jgi:hypothetical protein
MIGALTNKAACAGLVTKCDFLNECREANSWRGARQTQLSFQPLARDSASAPGGRSLPIDLPDETGTDTFGHLIRDWHRARELAFSVALAAARHPVR